MVEFNLLPWRINQRQYEYIVLKRLLGILAAILIGQYFSINFLCARQLAHAQRCVGALNQELMRLAPIQQKMQNYVQQAAMQQTIKRMTAYQQQTNRLLQTQTEQKRVCFTSIVRDGNRVLVTGEAYSPHDLKKFLHTWPLLENVGNWQLLQLRPSNHGAKLKFRLLGQEEKML